MQDAIESMLNNLSSCLVLAEQFISMNFGLKAVNTKQAMLNACIVTMAWCVLKLWMEQKVSIYEG
jgi:hypothetical protein